MKKGLYSNKLLFLLLGIVLIASVFASLSVVSATGTGTSAKGAACSKNDDCSGTLVCIAGKCAEPAPSTSILTEEKAKNYTSGGGFICNQIRNNWWKEHCSLWLGGWDTEALGPYQINLMGQMIKWILLILIIILIYSGLKAVDAPESTALKVVIAVVVGFLATFLITTNELLTMMQGYTAMGVALAVFLPFFIMGAFTVMVARSLSPIGIYLQKVLWVIFSVYMVVKTFVLWAALNQLGNVKVGLHAGQIINTTFFQINVTQGLLNMAQHTDKTMLFTLAVASIVSLFIMLGNNVVLRWLAKEDLDSAVQAEKSMLAKSRARDALHAQDLEKGSKQ